MNSFDLPEANLHCVASGEANMLSSYVTVTPRRVRAYLYTKTLVFVRYCRHALLILLDDVGPCYIFSSFPSAAALRDCQKPFPSLFTTTVTQSSSTRRTAPTVSDSGHLRLEIMVPYLLLLLPFLPLIVGHAGALFSSSEVTTRPYLCFISSALASEHVGLQRHRADLPL